MVERRKINGVEIFFEMTGDSGEPLVLVHGSWIDHHNWDAVVPALSRSFQVLTYDRRGHSESQRPNAQGSIYEDAADLAGLITELGLAPAHVAGGSFGGSIALRLAGERPELFRSLIVCEPPLMGLLPADSEGQKTLQAIGERLGAVTELLRARDHAGGARQFVETVAFGPGAWAQVPPEVRQTAIFNAPTFLDEMLDPEAFSIDLTRLEKFSHPVLLIRGEHGVPFAPPIIERLASTFPDAETKVFPGAGHEPEHDDPEAYVKTLETFIAKAKKPSAIASKWTLR